MNGRRFQVLPPAPAAFRGPGFPVKGSARPGPARWLGAVLCLGLFGPLGCSGRAAPPGPGQSRGSVPDLRGHSVLVLPIQRLPPLPPESTPDQELAFALKDRSGRVRWIFAPEVEEALSRSPGIRGRLRDLPVGAFLQGEVKRIGDPLFGELRRLTVLVDAEFVLIPVELGVVEGGGFSLGAALLTARDGRVSWYGVVQGKSPEGRSTAALASAAEALARAVVPVR